MFRPALIFSTVLIVGCWEAPKQPSPTTPAAPSMDLGVGVGVGFELLADGVELTLVPGAQGGFHVDLEVRTDLEGEVAVTRQARRADTGELVSRGKFRASVLEDGSLDRTVPLFLCPAPVDIAVADEALEVEYVLETEAGEARAAALIFVPRCPTGGSADFCIQICR